MKHTTILIALLGYALFANANDSTAVRIAGHLEFKKTSDIAILTEDLLISVNKVRVTYTFRNDSKRDIEELIAFPIQEDAWEYESLTMPERTEFVKNLIDDIAFKVIGSEMLSPVEHELKIDNNVAHITYFWQQKFPADKIITVSHEYQPNGGFIMPKSVATEWGKEWKAVENDYCIEPKLNKWISQHGQSTNQVHYILTTGANWKKPIEHFKLTIKKQTPAQKVSLCVDNIRKIDDTTFQMEQKNFLPIRDLRVLFINP